MAIRLFRTLRRRLHWLAGRGWSAEDFADRYERSAGDVWGYRGSPEHKRRAEWILAALPEGRFRKALEVGCAQGFLTEFIAARVDHLIACDISSEAVRQARENCRDIREIVFKVADIRNDFPADDFDLCIFSDVLYYLSRREIDAVLDKVDQKIARGGYLVIVNEWNQRYRGLTSPTYSFARLDAHEGWERASRSQASHGKSELSMAIYRRRFQAPNALIQGSLASVPLGGRYSLPTKPG